MNIQNQMKIVALTVSMLITGSIQAQITAAQITAAQIDRLVEDAMAKFEVAGVAVGVVKDGMVIHTQGYGLKSVQSKAKVDEHTQFAIASNSKAFTAASLAILVDEGKISWHDKVKDHIPEFKMYNAYVTENFTIEDLLTHRSGLGLGAGDLIFFPDGTDFEVKDLLSIFQHFEPKSAFRTKYDYDNLLYLVAGEVIHRVSGMKWEQFAKTRIMRPLGMNNSYTDLMQITDRGNVADPHSTEKGTLEVISHFEHNPNLGGAAGGIFSNVHDLCQWMLVQLNQGKYGEQLESQLFSEYRQREMWKIHTTIPVSRNPNYARYHSHFRGYGLGWGLTDISGKMSVSHTGGLPGMLSKTILIPDLELGIVVLTNTHPGGGGVFQSVTQTILDSYLGMEDFGWTDKLVEERSARLAKGDAVTERVWERVEKARDVAVDAAAYTGIYVDPWFGKVEVFTKEDQLWILAHRSPKLNGPLQFYKANAFAVKWEYQDMNADAFVIFSLDEEGKSQSIQIKGISPNIDFSFDFQDLNLRRGK